jgi:phytol kinase
MLARSSWLAIGVALGAFLLLFVALQLYARATSAQPETTRKLFHTGSGILTLSFPFLFRETWPVFLLTGASAVVIGLVKFVPALRRRYGTVANRVDRTTMGELYFPLSVAWLFAWTLGADPLLFVIPILMLTFADATCAIVGRRYGLTPYHGANKSLEGSVAFVVVAFFCVHVPLLLWSEVGRTESLLTASTLAMLVMVLEGSAWRGLDNVFIPVGGYFLLRAYLDMDAAALLLRFLITLGLVLLVLIARHRTTLEDDSLALGAFLSYVAWALMGWLWLVGPLAILVGYRWLSPPTPDNSRRMHGVAAVLSVWGAAVCWLALASASGDRSLLFPYTIVFAAHLAMFGVSRLAYQFRAIAVSRLFWRAVFTSALVVLGPFLAAVRPSLANVYLVTAGIGAIAFGTLVFVQVNRAIRDLPQTPRRWISQAGGAVVASSTAWLLALGIAWIRA